MYSRLCSGGECQLDRTGNGDGIFYYSQATAVGDEICWDFITAVKSSRQSFSGFTKSMNQKYLTTHPRSTNFLSHTTWVKVVFSWIVSHKIDFRKEIDPYCGYDPKLLACDGTHIGVSVKHLKLDPPITKPELETSKDPNHKR